MNAASSSNPAQIKTNFPVLVISSLPLRFIIRKVSHRLEANAVEYAMNSNRACGKMNDEKKTAIADQCIGLLSVLLLSAATAAPELYSA